MIRTKSTTMMAKTITKATTNATAMVIPRHYLYMNQIQIVYGANIITLSRAKFYERDNNDNSNNLKNDDSMDLCVGSWIKGVVTDTPWLIIIIVSSCTANIHQDMYSLLCSTNHTVDFQGELCGKQNTKIHTHISVQILDVYRQFLRINCLVD